MFSRRKLFFETEAGLYDGFGVRIHYGADFNFSYTMTLLKN